MIPVAELGLLQHVRRKLPRVDAVRGRAVVPAGSLGDDPGAREGHHLRRLEGAWYEIADDLPRHETYPPGPYPPPSGRT